MSKQNNSSKLVVWLKTVLLFGSIMQFSEIEAQTLTPIEDAMVYKASPANNYGTDVKLWVKKKEASTNVRNAYLKFDMAGITVAQVGKAKLRLYCNNKALENIYSVMAAYSTTNAWTESTLTFANAPLLNSTLATSVIVSKFNYYEWDVTDYIKQSLSSGTITSLVVTDANFSDNLIEFSSKEATNKPELVITPVADPVNVAYYLDAIEGNDNNNGSSAATAWRTLNKINSTYLSAGAEIYFKSGQTFTGLFNISTTGTAANPVIVDVYGGVAPALIRGQGQPSAVFAYNRSYLEIKNLIVTNFRPGVIASADVFSAITIINEDAGTLNHIYFDNVIVDSVNSSNDEADGGTVYNGGLRFYTSGSAVQSKFNDVVIKNSKFQNLSRTGCNFRSDWELRNVNTVFGQNLGDGRTDNWIPNTNVVIRDNIFRQIAGNGLIVRVAHKALVEGNFFDSCGTIISGNATFCFNTDSTIYQFNEAQNTVYNTGDTDARGIDADFRTKATVIQYNYLHDNGLGGVVATGGDQTTGQIPERFNVTSVIRYNLLENNARQGISFSGAINGLDVYNNTLYADASEPNVLIVRMAIWAVAPKNVRFKNNIFYFLGANPSYSFATGSTYSFINNLFFGIRPPSEPADPNKITADPRLSNPGNEDGYKYLAGSAALNSGMLIPNNGGRDYYGVPVSSSTPPNVGMYNGPAVAPVPVRLLNFFAKKSGNKTELIWTTANEANTLNFEIERSANGVQFDKIGTLPAAGNSSALINYSLQDLSPVKGINYYRLKQVDRDGKFTYSIIRMLNFGGPLTEVIVYPNPADNEISVALNINNDVPVLVSIFNIQGKKLKEILLTSSSNIELDIKGLSRGLYMIQVNHSLTNEVLGKARFLKL